MAPTTKVFTSSDGVPNSSTQSEQDGSKEGSIQLLQKEDQLLNSEEKFPSGWWIVPLMFAGVTFWIMVAFWLFI